jgi:hypothetical protein
MDGENLYMKNSLTTKVISVGKVILKMISEKLLTLNDILHVADIKKNLMSNLLLRRKWF